jgi:gliding motility-associated lipoprotein GldH
MKKILPLLLGTLLLASCGKKTLIDDERTFNGDVWNRFTPEVFEFDVSNTENFYDIDLTVSIDTLKYRYDIVPVTVNLYSPNSERRMFYAEVPLKLNGRWRGEVVDGRRTVSNHIRTFFSFNSVGKHRMEVGQATSQYDLEGIHSLQLNIYKVDLDYPDQ